MNTPEGRKKAAKEAEAELAEKRRSWGTRAWALPMDGFVGITDSARDKELKIYTRTYDLKHKFWGIKPVGMAIWDFWDIFDPEVKRYYDANQETPASPEASTVAPPPTDSPQHIKVTTKPRRRQASLNINSTNRVKKSTIQSPRVNKNTQKSLAHNIDAGHPALEAQIREVPIVTPVSDRTTRKRTAETVANAQQHATEGRSSAPSKPRRGRPPAKAKTPAKGDTLPPKRPRGRPPVKTKPTEGPPKPKKTPAVKGNARVTKPPQTERRRPPVPSTHKMRTRGKGPAERLQIP